MKSKSKVLLSSIASIALCSSIAVGGTFALFTSESKVNIAVTAGTVEVVATINNLKTYSIDVEQPEGTFENGGGAELDPENQTLDISYMAPMDKVSFNIVIENKSNIDIKYQTQVVVVEDTGLLPALSITVGEQKYDGVSAYSDWMTWEEQGTVTVPVTIEFPDAEDNNDYMGESISFTYKVLAVQGNATPWETVTAANLANIDFTEENTKFVFSGTFDAVTISELGDGSVIDFDNATVGAFTIQDDAVLTGNATIASLTGVRNDSTPIEMTISDATFDIAGDLNVKNTLNGSVLNIVDSSVECTFLFVGEHTNNATAALAEFNVVNSYLRCEENDLGSTISVWGRSGVKSTIYDSEIHTYSRGWHQSEDANDNAITFQGATSIDVDIQRSNIHTYGFRSIINVRQYGSEETTINASIDDSLIWVITKSTHNPETIPVWGFNSITDTALVFTKNVTAPVDQVVDSSFVYGNPVIHGNFNLHSNCNCSWNAYVALDNETVTFAADANISVDDACSGSLNFVLSDTAKIVVENGATVSGKINIVAADGYTLNTVTENGVTTYSVSAN